MLLENVADQLRVTFTEDVSTVPFGADNVYDADQDINSTTLVRNSAHIVTWGCDDPSWGGAGDDMDFQPPAGYEILPSEFSFPPP